MRKFLFAGVVMAALAVGGASCGEGSKITPAEGLLLSCKAFTKELDVLSPLRADGTLSATAVKIVQAQKDAVDPICLGEAPDVNADVKSITVDAGTKVLVGVAAQFLTK